MKSLNKGFTVIELMFVIVIIGIVAAVVVPKLQEHKTNVAIEKSLNQQNEETTEW